MRRRITRVVLAVIVAILTAGLVTSCAKKGSADNPNPAKVNAKYNFKDRTLDVLFMVGGQGQMADPIAEKLKAVYPGLTINIVYDHNEHELMRNRIMAGNPPDIFDLNQGFYDYYGAISEGVCKPLDFIYPLKTVDGSKTLKEVIDFGSLKKGYFNDKYYLMADSIYTSGLWYDAKLLRDLSITPPTTWDEFVKALEVLKSKGKKGLAWSGKWAAEYAYDYFFYPQVASVDYKAYVALQNLEPDAWSNPAVLEVINRIGMMRDKGFFDKKSAGLDASEIQMELIKRTFAFYPCGSWLEAEMSGNWPKDFELTYLPFSGRTDASGKNYTLLASVVSAVSAKTKNEDIAGEYYRYMLSDKDVTTKIVKGALNGLPLMGFSDQFGSLLPKSVQGTWAAINGGNVQMVDMAQAWYKEFQAMAADALNAFIAGNITAQEFADRMNKYSKKLVDDSSVVKYKLAAE